MDLGQILWTTPYPPDLQNFFFFFTFLIFPIFLSRFRQHGTLWEQQFQNATPLVFIRSEPNFVIKG